VKILDNSNYDKFPGSCDFSHAYLIMHTYFGKKLEMQTMNTEAFIYKLICFVAWIFFVDFVDTWGHKF